MFTFRKDEKVVSPIDVQKVRNNGKAMFVFPFKVYYLEKEDQNNNRIVVSVPKKIFKRAVVRNLLRRRTKESYRLNKVSIESNLPLDILLVYTFNGILEYERIDRSIKEIISKVSKNN